MVKYILGTLVALAAIAAAVFVLASTRSDRQEGPAPLVEIRVSDAGLTPATIEVEKGRLVEYQLANNASAQRTISTPTDKVEMLPAESDVLDEHNATVPVPYINITASPGGVTSALVRFTEGGEYELHVQTAGRPETLQIARVIVR